VSSWPHIYPSLLHVVVGPQSREAGVTMTIPLDVPLSRILYMHFRESLFYEVW
jgi:hypothetical protein